MCLANRLAMGVGVSNFMRNYESRVAKGREPYRISATSLNKKIKNIFESTKPFAEELSKLQANLETLSAEEMEVRVDAELAASGL
jgi:hypothetical protein